MKADGTPETGFEEGMPLLGAIIEANVRSLQWTNDQLLASKEQELLNMQKAFLKLYKSMEKVADRTDSATAFDALNRFSYYADVAEKAVGDTKYAY